MSEIGLVAVAFALAAVVATDAQRPVIDLLFLGVLLSFLLLLSQLLWRAVVRARLARDHERQVLAVEPSEAVRRAVEDERTRLSCEIDRCVQSSLRTVSSLVATADGAADPRPFLVAIQAESRTAMNELRRQLGLIGADSDASGGDGATVAQGKDPEPSSRYPHAHKDAAMVVALCVLVTAEHSLIANTEAPASWLMSALLALTVLARRRAPIPAALAGAAILVLGVVMSAPVGDGFSFPIVVGLLLWSLLERRPSALALAIAALLMGCAVGSRYAHDPSNAALNIALLATVSLVAHLFGRARSSRASSQRRAEGRQQELSIATEAATRTTRREMAHELHDVVSHAVSLVAIQAAAAEMAWPDNPDATRSGLRVIEETISSALTDLNAERWGEAPAPGWADVTHTISRLRGAGLVVSLHTTGRPPEQLQPTVHRLVQEALTNVLKHAPDANASVVVTNAPDRTIVEVTDDGPGPAQAALGYGLIGLEERVTAAGGVLHISRANAGGFAVRAVLPHHAASARQEVAP